MSAFRLLVVALLSSVAVLAHAQTWPDKLAVADPRVRLTYKDYYSRVQRLAAQFASMGLSADDVRALADPETGLALPDAVVEGHPWQEPDEVFVAAGRTDLHTAIDTEGRPVSDKLEWTFTFVLPR